MTYLPRHDHSTFVVDRPSPREASAPGAKSLLFGVVLPAFALVFELATGLCAGAFFDPLPDWEHVLLVAAVPLVNFLLWRAARGGWAPGWLGLAGGAAVAVSGAYALLFLPLLPLAVLAVLLFGLGLLPFAPVGALVSGVRWINRLDVRTPGTLRRAARGFAAGCVLLLVIDLPGAATSLALGWAADGPGGEARAVRLMRALGDEDALLGIAGGEAARSTGLLSFAAEALTDGLFARQEAADRETARRLYFRATGLAYNATSHRPSEVRQGWFWDNERGGERVGGRVPGLSLAASRFDGSVSAPDNLAYLEWTAELANAAAQTHEARLQLALPEGAVVSRATLWVNGEPREASVAGRGETRAAYQGVVSAQRDPLLVTTLGADRVLIQAFPIQPGGTMKLRLGITAPLAVASDGQRSLALPQIAERNLEIDDGLKHAIWIEGGGGKFRRDVTHAAYARKRPRIPAPSATPSVRSATLPAQRGQARLATTQVLRPVPADNAPLFILVDGSSGNADAAKALRAALPIIAPGRPVGLAIAGEGGGKVPVAPWNRAQSRRFADALDGAAFSGGEDNLPALAAAAAAVPAGNLLWVHGPQPVTFPGSAARLDQVLERVSDLPRLHRYQEEPGPVFAVPGTPWFDAARFAFPSADPRADLRALLAELGGAKPRWRPERIAGVDPQAAPGSPHLLYLWAADQLAEAGAAVGKEREGAVALAHRLNLVTPVSGAVVLETDRDYEANGLPVPAAGEVPTLPEPGVWALLLVVAGAAGWAIRRRHRAPAAVRI